MSENAAICFVVCVVAVFFLFWQQGCTQYWDHNNAYLLEQQKIEEECK